MSRRSGLLIPLFSMPSSDSWGIGEFGDVPRMVEWLQRAGQRVVQLLPLNEMALGQHSPYSAMSALALDPIFISLPSVPEFAAAGGEASMSMEDQARLARVRQSPRIDYAEVRRLKRSALARAFAVFGGDRTNNAARDAAFQNFRAKQASWLSDYALFRALQDREDGRPWTAWPEPLRDRDESALDQARVALERETLFYEYQQWLAGEQWQAARRAARQHDVALFGDLPFMVDTNSADVWVHQQSVRLDVSIGVPPDAFSATGQDWGMPLYGWDTMAKKGFPWLRQRAARSAELFDGYRIDHLVGFYRTYGRPLDGRPPFFTPADEAQQIALGECVLQIMREPGAEIIAEDLGIVPDFVRHSLARLGVPGFRVQRWERYWHAAGQPFVDPRDYPPNTVATSGTHDTESMAVWWDAASLDERRLVNAGIAERAFDNEVRDRLIEMLFQSGSDLVLFPIPDVFGWRDRINEPATVNDKNWTFRLLWPIDRLDSTPEAAERQAKLRDWSARSGRFGHPEGLP